MYYQRCAADPVSCTVAFFCFLIRCKRLFSLRWFCFAMKRLLLSKCLMLPRQPFAPTAASGIGGMWAETITLCQGLHPPTSKLLTSGAERPQTDLAVPAGCSSTSKSHPQPEPCYPAKPCAEGPCSLGMLVPARPALASLCHCFAECRILPLWGDVVLAESPGSLRVGHHVTWPGQVWLYSALRAAQCGCPGCMVGGTNPSQPPARAESTRTRGA